MLLLEEWGTCFALGAVLSLWLTARLCTSSCRFLLQIKHILFNVCKEVAEHVETNLLSIKIWVFFFFFFLQFSGRFSVILLFPAAGAQCVLAAALGCCVGQHCWTCIVPLLPACWFSLSLIQQKVVLVCTKHWSVALQGCTVKKPGMVGFPMGTL